MARRTEARRAYEREYKRKRRANAELNARDNARERAWLTAHPEKRENDNARARERWQKDEQHRQRRNLERCQRQKSTPAPKAKMREWQRSFHERHKSNEMYLQKKDAERLRSKFIGAPDALIEALVLARAAKRKLKKEIA